MLVREASAMHPNDTGGGVDTAGHRRVPGSPPHGRNVVAPCRDRCTGGRTGVTTDTIADLLAERYGLTAHQVVQLPIGQTTVNYRVGCTGRDVFVKCYHSGADLTAEAAAVDMSQAAGRHGVPVPAVLLSRSGAIIEDGVSVWEWMPGGVVLDRLTIRQYESMGDALGSIHAAFAGLPGGNGPAQRVEYWKDTSHLADRLARLRALVAERIDTGKGDSFDQRAAQTLAEREKMLEYMPELLAGLPELGVQLLQGDYAPPNVLFDDDQLTAVLDFRPPEPFLIAYELGRAAFGPDHIVTDPQWLTGTRTLIASYLATNPAIRPEDLRACGRVALFQLVRSLYGVKEHYLKPGLFQDQLDRFWLRRHHAATLMLDRLQEIDTMLAELADAAGKESK